MSDIVIAKRFPLSIVVFLVLVLLMASGAGAMMLVSHVRTLKVESKTFADSAVSGMAVDWTNQQLQQRLSPAAQARLKPADVNALAELRAKMGHFESDAGATGGLEDPLAHLFIGSPRATYEAKAIFVNGVAIFHLGMVKPDGRWLIDTYHIDVQYYGVPSPEEFNAAPGRNGALH